MSTNMQQLYQDRPRLEVKRFLNWLVDGGQLGAGANKHEAAPYPYPYPYKKKKKLNKLLVKTLRRFYRRPLKHQEIANDMCGKSSDEAPTWCSLIKDLMEQGNTKNREAARKIYKARKDYNTDLTQYIKSRNPGLEIQNFGTCCLYSDYDYQVIFDILDYNPSMFQKMIKTVQTLRKHQKKDL